MIDKIFMFWSRDLDAFKKKQKYLIQEVTTNFEFPDIFISSQAPLYFTAAEISKL